jgi:hypothetical protein
MEEKKFSSIYLNHTLKKPIRISLRNLILGVIILLLLAGNIYFIIQYSTLRKELKETRAELQTKEFNEKIINFTSLFIEEVLKAEGEIDFETRLSLENAVRNLGDEEILSQWREFTESETEAGAQIEVKNLLEILVSKIKE